MKNLNNRPILYAILIVSAMLWVGIAFVTRADMGKLFDFFKILPTVATFDLILWLVFTKWAWKWKIFKGWLVPFPDLNGTWHGTISSTWVDPESGKTVDPIPAILTIRQTFGRISCVIRTAEMASHSVAEDFQIDDDNQIRQLAYLYSSKPVHGVSERSAQHNGAIILDVIETPSRKLKGEYWTQRKTTGHIAMEFRCKELLEELPEDMQKHPMQKSTDDKDEAFPATVPKKGGSISKQMENF